MSLIKYVGHVAVGGAATAILLNFAKRWYAERGTDALIEAQIEPGAWFAYYMGDFMVDHNTDRITSAIVELRDGSFIWATSTPDWDHDWFADTLGWEFPARWVPYTELDGRNLDQVELGS